jgi:hypothetical protein
VEEPFVPEEVEVLDDASPEELEDPEGLAELAEDFESERLSVR